MSLPLYGVICSSAEEGPASPSPGYDITGMAVPAGAAQPSREGASALVISLTTLLTLYPPELDTFR